MHDPASSEQGVHLRRPSGLLLLLLLLPEELDVLWEEEEDDSVCEEENDEQETLRARAASADACVRTQVVIPVLLYYLVCVRSLLHILLMYFVHRRTWAVNSKTETDSLQGRWIDCCLRIFFAF